MANNSNKLKTRDLSEQDEGPYLTRPSHDAALEAQLNAEAPTGDVRVNPNPFGEEDYVNTDPIYQNYSTDVNKPFASEDGVEKDAEERYQELHSLDDVDDNLVVHDYGTGGKARVAQDDGAGVPRYLVPGQEGYDEKSQASGPAVRADAPDNDSSSESVEVPEPPNPEDPQNPNSPAQPVVE